MILYPILSFLVLMLFGYSIVKLFFRRLDIYETIVASVAISLGLFTYLFFILNQFFGVKFDFTTTIIFTIILLILSVIMIIIDNVIFCSAKKDRSARKAALSIKYFAISFCSKLRYFFKNSFRKNTLIKIIICIMILLIIYKSMFFPIPGGDGIGFHIPMMQEIFESGTLPQDVGPNTIEFARAYPPALFILGAWTSILDQNFNEYFIKFLPVFFGLMSLFVVYLLAKNVVFKNELKALLACFLLLTFPMFVNQTVHLNNDTIFTFFAIVGIYFVMKYLQDRQSNHLILGFAALGFAINTKQLGIPFLISILIPLFFILFYKKIVLLFKRKITFKNFIQNKESKLFVMSVIVLIIVIAPYFIRNYIFFGDPVYPYLSNTGYFHGKNFVPFLYEPVADAYARTTLFYSPGYSLFGIVNFIRDKDYSMSLFFIVLIGLILINFKRLSKEQKYLLYFSIFFTIYYAYSFMLKYRYYMVITALLCVMVASKLDDILRFKITSKERKILWIFLAVFILSIIAYLLLVINSAYVIKILGSLAEHFISGLDVLILMHLIVIICALIVILVTTNKKIKYVLLILLLALPSLYSLIMINYSLTTDALGVIDTSKNFTLFFDKVLRPIPDKDVVLEMYYGDTYDVQVYMRDNLPRNTMVLSYDGNLYYSNLKYILIDSYRMAFTYKDYNATLADSLNILKYNNITYIHYKIPGWDEQVFDKGQLYDRSLITQNLNDTRIFEPVYRNKDYVIYRVLTYDISKG